jgi:hypothetical protein
MCLIRYSTNLVEFDYLKIESWHASCAFTRAGFESATVFSPLKELSSLNKLLVPLSTLRYGDTNQMGVLLT